MALTRPRAYQIYDLDYKQSVRVVTVSNVTLAGGAPNAVDGVNLSVNDRILVTGQSNPVQNGIYYVTTLGTGANGTWARSIDTDTTGELDSGTIVMVTEGSIYADTQWKLTTNDPITIGSTALTFVQNYLANSISYGQTAFAIGSANANATVSVASTSNVAVFATTGAFITGVASATGNITGGNLTTTGLITATGNITGGNVNATGGSFTGNVNFGNIFVGGYYWANGTAFSGGGGGTPGGSNTQIQFNDNGVFGGSAGLTFNKTTNAVSATGAISATGNVTGGNVTTAGLISATGAITGAAITGTTISGSGNLTGANINTGGLVSATGNVNGGNINVTGDIYDTGPLRIITAASGAISLAPNTSNVAVISTTGVAVTGIMSASGNVTGGNLVTAGLISATGAITGAAITGTTISGSGNLTGANINTGGLVSATGNLNTSSGVLATGNIRGGNLISAGTITTAGNIATSGANGVANIGAVGAFFNIVHARATSAQYADVAEYYTSDANYEPGTVVVFGGSAEVTMANQSADNTVAGVVSTNPAYIMNAGIQFQQSVAVALTGRVPTKVLGPVRKGNMMVSAANGYAQACATPAVGTVIGKSIENFDGIQGVIEIVVGRL